MRLRSVLIAAAALLSSVNGTAAQDKWPSSRITLLVPFAAGTITDATTRLLADQLKDALGQPIIVENRAGAGATLGSRLVARAAPDGYTLLVGGNTTHSIVPSLFKTPPYDPIKDFTPIARIVKLGSVLATNLEQPFKTIHELVAYARAHPGKLTYGHGNSGGQIIGETIKAKLGLDIVRLPYPSTPPAMTDLLSNNIQLMFPDSYSGIPLMEAGKLIGLAVATKTRHPRLPDTPTLHETFIPGFEMLPWFGMFGPAGLPREVVERMSGALAKLLAEEAFVHRLAAVGPEPYYLPPDAFAEFIKADLGVWAEHARIAGITAQ